MFDERKGSVDLQCGHEEYAMRRAHNLVVLSQSRIDEGRGVLISNVIMIEEYAT
jgi:hypothetical protein